MILDNNSSFKTDRRSSRNKIKNQNSDFIQDVNIKDLNNSDSKLTKDQNKNQRLDKDSSEILDNTSNERSKQNDITPQALILQNLKQKKNKKDHYNQDKYAFSINNHLDDIGDTEIDDSKYIQNEKNSQNNIFKNKIDKKKDYDKINQKNKKERSRKNQLENRENKLDKQKKQNLINKNKKNYRDKIQQETYKEKIKERKRIYNEINNEKIKERKRIYLETNKEKINELRRISRRKKSAYNQAAEGAENDKVINNI